MAEVALHILVENLKQVLLHYANLISNAKYKVEDLEIELRRLRALLMDSSKNLRKDKTFQELVGEIRDVVHEIEDVIDSYIYHATGHKKSRNYFKKKVLDPLNLIKEAEKVTRITQKVEILWKQVERQPHAAMVRETYRKPKVRSREDNIVVVGFDEDAKNIIKYLKEETDELDVISIVGLPGLGKTTLASKLFDDPSIPFEFPTRIWVDVSQEFKTRDVYLAILSKLIRKSNREITQIPMKNKSDLEVGQTWMKYKSYLEHLKLMKDNRLQTLKMNKMFLGMAQTLVKNRSDQVIAQKLIKNNSDREIAQTPVKNRSDQVIAQKLIKNNSDRETAQTLMEDESDQVIAQAQMEDESDLGMAQTLEEDLSDLEMAQTLMEDESDQVIAQAQMKDKSDLEIAQTLMKDKSDQEIAQTLRGHLDKAKFLIVMDDVWTADAWDKLKDAFPKKNKKGKILITSRSMKVARQANANRDPYKLRLLTTNHSLQLLQLKVFDKPHCSEDLEPYGIKIAEKCGGLPLAIVVIGGILRKKSQFGDTIAMKNAWRKVSEAVPTYLYKEDEDGDEDSYNYMKSIIDLSYNKLPYHLKSCFLYLAMFPEDFEIPVWTLIRLWIAEGFVKEETDLTLEQTAEDYLEELVNRNLVMVEKMSTDGKIKTCRVHDILRQFCKNESRFEKENFLLEMKKSDGWFKLTEKKFEKCRRLCIHSNIVEFLSLPELHAPRVRSFVCSSKEELEIASSIIDSSIPSAFKLLKILDAKPINFTKFPPDLTHLVHLRYIVLSGNFKDIPGAVAELWNLQSLIVYTSSRILEIKANIWRMLQLRHVKTNASAILPMTGKSTKELFEKLQTLGTISPQSCTEDVFDRLRSLRKLGIRGLLVALVDLKGLNNLNNLDKLKLVNDVSNSPSSGGKLPRLPEHHRFPPNLRSLTLCSTYLDWGHMSTLDKLNTLEVLKLKKNAFVGEHWRVSIGYFRHLEVLHIEQTNLVVWMAEADQFPRLNCLVIKNCEQLCKIPDALSEVQSFQRLDLKRAPNAAESAREIEKAKARQQEQEADTFKRIKFKLRIAPGDE